MKNIKSIAVSAFLLSCSGLAYAQDQAATMPAPSTTAQPVEITADNALEWDRPNKKYFARGHAIAKQNDFQVEGDTLIADYREDPKGGTQIYQLTAEGHVVLTNSDHKAYGEHAIYEVDSAKATMTGKDLHIDSPDIKITAQEKFEYYSNEGKMVAYGAPVITNKDSVLTADKITAWTNPKTAEKTEELKPTTTSKMGNLKRAEAEGHVVITTPKEKATSDKAIYTGENDTVELLDNVHLFQGQNTLEGNRAQMNLTTKVSKMFGAPEKGGRVKGVFFTTKSK